jgi:hypothetical protein
MVFFISLRHGKRKSNSCYYSDYWSNSVRCNCG